MALGVDHLRHDPADVIHERLASSRSDERERVGLPAGVGQLDGAIELTELLADESLQAAEALGLTGVTREPASKALQTPRSVGSAAPVRVEVRLAPGEKESALSRLRVLDRREHPLEIHQRQQGLLDVPRGRGALAIEGQTAEGCGADGEEGQNEARPRPRRDPARLPCNHARPVAGRRGMHIRAGATSTRPRRRRSKASCRSKTPQDGAPGLHIHRLAPCGKTLREDDAPPGPRSASIVRSCEPDVRWRPALGLDVSSALGAR
jgi:hypothetical protein